MPDEFQFDTLECLKDVKKNREIKQLEENKLTDAEWEVEKIQWKNHYNEQKKLPYVERFPYIDQYGACIMAIASPKKAPGYYMDDGEKRYFDQFASGLLSDFKKGLRKEITIFDSKGKSTFAEWYFINEIASKVVGYVRGKMNKVKYRNTGDEANKKGDWDNVYAKKRGVEKVSELETSSYERMFTLNIWEFRKMPVKVS